MLQNLSKPLNFHFRKSTSPSQNWLEKPPKTQKKKFFVFEMPFFLEAFYPVRWADFFFGRKMFFFRPKVFVQLESKSSMELGAILEKVRTCEDDVFAEFLAGFAKMGVSRSGLLILKKHKIFNF
jgi:hypothetical protein